MTKNLILFFIIAYLLGAFYEVSFNIKIWSNSTKSWVIFGWLFIVFIYFVFKKMMEEIKS